MSLQCGAVLDCCWINATLVDVIGGKLIPNAWIRSEAGIIHSMGLMSDFEKSFPTPQSMHVEIVDVDRRLITPGFIDAHSHRVYAGNRQDEVDALLAGESYAALKMRGGGIDRTIRDTVNASEESLLMQAMPRMIEALKSGLTTIEIKSGYGNDWDSELKLLQVAKRIDDALPLTVMITFLGAHTPPFGVQSADTYIDRVCEMIPRVAALGFVHAVDVFCDHVGFSLQQTERVFQVAVQNGLAIKCHAEQLTYSGAAELALRYGAISVDHLEHLPAQGNWIEMMQANDAVAVLLPVTYHHLRHDDPTLPPISTLKAHNIPLAIASNCNPGNAPQSSILVALHLAELYYQLSPLALIRAVTYGAAKALGLEKTHGILARGFVADLAIWDVRGIDCDVLKEIYSPHSNPLFQLVKGGKPVDLKQLATVRA